MMQNFEPFIRTNRINPCPICGKNGWCEISSDGKTVHCMYTPSDKEIESRGGGWLHYLDKEINWKSHTKHPAKASTKTFGFSGDKYYIPLDSITLDKINREITSFLSLSDEHKERVAKKYPNIPAELFGSFKRTDGPRIVKHLIEKFGKKIVLRHPAVKSDLKFVGYYNGLILPAYDEVNNLVLGLQLRKDEVRTINENRFIWLSHDGRGGTPSTFLKATTNLEMLIITEGLGKAAYGRNSYGGYVIGLPGVSIRPMDLIIDKVSRLGINRIVVAFDADKIKNENVKKAEQKLLKSLAEQLPDSFIEVMNWKLDDGKGLDDVILAGGQISFELYSFGKRKKFADNLPLHYWQKEYGDIVKPVYSLNEARNKHYELALEILSSKENRKICLTSITGTGKSTAFDNAAAILVLEGKLEKRILILCPNKDNLKDRTKPETNLGKAIAAGKAAIQQGRQEASLKEPTPFDCWNPAALEAGKMRQIPTKVICKECIFKSRCEESGYLASRKRSEQAQLVIATKDSYLNNSDKQLAEFDTVIIDEDVIPYLFETIEIDAATIATWREAATVKKIVLNENISQLFKVIELTLAEAPSHFADKLADKTSIFPVYDLIQAKAFETGISSIELGFGLLVDKDEILDTYPFEKPYSINGMDKIPLKAFGELLEALKAGDARIKAVKQNDGTFKLQIIKLRTHLIDCLNNQNLIILDATLPPIVKELFPKIEEKKFDVAQKLEVWQLSNSLYTARELLANESQREDIKQIAAKWFVGSNKGLAVIPLRFEGKSEKQLEFPDNVQVIHYGQHKATNKHIGTDAMIITGHWMRPFDTVKAELDCLRSYGYFKGEAVKSDERLIIYNYNQNGKTAGYWKPASDDLVLQQIIEAEYAANIIQTIGRARAVENECRILIASSEPIRGLKVDKLLTAKELLACETSSNVVYPILENYIDNIYINSQNMPDYIENPAESEWTNIAEVEEEDDEDFADIWEANYAELILALHQRVMTRQQIQVLSKIAEEILAPSQYKNYKIEAEYKAGMLKDKNLPLAA